MKKFFIVLALVLTGATITYYWYPIQLLGDLKARNAFGGGLFGGHTLYFRGDKIGYLNGLDSWYIQGSVAYGTMTYNQWRTNEGVVYFYIDVCTDDVLLIKNHSLFEDFLDAQGIDKDKRNYMSGYNFISMKTREYSSSYRCV
ncbi:hypothetical protein [Psychrobacter aestuarii]|uniref:Uncharacterized protein n=1 Tax=Psychrobacter aestuarii TaxID=556327 RepID=A0ABN0VNA0_9GAMM|nr:hypothetical protein [Psychrobacter aestuarii]